MLSHGFSPVIYDDGGEPSEYEYAVVNEEMGIIVKNPYIMCSVLSDRDFINIKGICPTLQYNVGEGTRNEYIYIQPVCNIDDVSRADIEYLEGLFDKGDFVGLLRDCAKRNVGIYEGNPVMFDW